MQNFTTALVLSLLCGANTAFAQLTVDCSKSSLSEAVANAAAGETITFTGVCSGSVVILKDGLTLQGAGSAIIDGQGRDAVSITGAQRITLANFEIRNGLNGISGNNGAHLSLNRVSSHNNVLSGISLQTGSGATLTGVSANSNGIHGLDVVTGSAATITGDFTATGNRVFGMDVNGSSVTFTRANVTASGNALGMQIATGSNAFLADSATVLNVSNNLAVGLTVVSGAHMVSFGGTINATGNPINGVSVNSKAGLDLDAASVLNSSNNGQDGVLLQEQSVMTVFNTPQFSGASGFSTINAGDNGGNGVTVQTGSTLTLVNQARVNALRNTKVGLLADNGSGLTLVNSTLTGNAKDIQLSFGARADLQRLTFATWSCDNTVLLRGNAWLLCPH